MNGEQKLIDRTSTSGAIYYGIAGSGIATTTAQWTIIKVELNQTNEPESIKYAGGVKDAIHKWSERTTLTYA